MVNPEMRDGLNGWFGFGNINDVNLTVGVSKEGNNFIIASNRKEPRDGFSQKFDLVKDNHYIVSGWIQLSEGEADVAAKFKTATGKVYAAWVVARSGCWSMFKGGFVANVSGPSELHFECNNTQTEIWAGSISVKAFTPEEWTSHQTKSVEKIRKTKVAIEVVDGEGKPLPNATISLIKGRPNLPFGCAINKNILNNKAYQNWFFSRFKYTVFEDEMKWYTTEPSQGREDYSAADALLRLVKARGVAVRGQNIFWDDPNFQPSWVPKLTPTQLSAAATKRINSVVRRYAGQVIHWDVVNENLHSSFFESRLGADASARFYRTASALDGKATPFLNDFNTIEHKEDGASSPSKYLQKIAQLRAQRYSGPLGIGLEAHFDTPDLAYVRTALDTLATAKLPIWITELDVSSRPNQAQYLGQIINELSSHPAVHGIVLWSAWKPSGCYKMCLTDNNFRNLATGDVVDGVIKAMSHEGLVGTTAANGSFETSLFHGEYEVQVDHPLLDQSLVHNLTVTSTVDSERRLYFSVSERV
nr:endo-1,4-beta-xylanase 5-like [Ipomoea batatas]GMD27708.1 endo-1,4-beta-xylanase 5-like [Ipomoea batatas]